MVDTDEKEKERRRKYKVVFPKMEVKPQPGKYGIFIFICMVTGYGRRGRHTFTILEGSQ